MSKGHMTLGTNIAVIIVTRGRADVLPSCLDGLRDQTTAPDEIILVAGDDASFPESLAAQYTDLPIRVALCPEPNICKARNIALEHASAHLLLFIDDDAIPHPGWIEAFQTGMNRDASAWAGGGTVLDARTTPSSPEYAHGMIRPSGTQIEVHNPARSGIRRGFVTSVKGCNFALRTDRFSQPMYFDPFFAFAFDEADLIMRVHALQGGVIHVPSAVVDHLHAPGMYRAQGPLDRDWKTEFASHTMFMLKHTRGPARVTGWCVICRRYLKHIIRATLGMLKRKRTPTTAYRLITEAFIGIRMARRVYRLRSASGSHDIV